MMTVGHARASRSSITHQIGGWWRRLPSPFNLPVPLLAAALGGIALIGALTLFLQERDMQMVMLGLAGMALGAIILVAPPVGLVALIGAAIGVRMTISTGTDSPIVASLGVGSVLVIAWFWHQILNGRPVSRLPRSLAVPAVAFGTITLVSMFWGHVTLDPRVVYPSNFYQVQVAAAWVTIVSIGLLFIGADLFRDRVLRSLLLAALVVTGFIALPFKALVLDLPILNTGGLFGMWFVAICWSQALANRRLPDPLRVVLGCGSVGWLGMAFFVERAWVSGWVPQLVAFITVTIFARPRLGGAIVLLALVFAAAYHSVFYQALVLDQEAEGSLGGEFGRTEMWQRGLSVLQDHLVLGTGPGGYALYYVTFIPNQAMSTHSNAVDVLAQQGVIGLLAFGALLYGIWRVGRGFTAVTLRDDDRALHAAVMGGFAGVVVSLFLGDWLIPFIYNQTIAGFDHSVYSWLMFAALCGLASSRGCHSAEGTMSIEP